MRAPPSCHLFLAYSWERVSPSRRWEKVDMRGAIEPSQQDANSIALQLGRFDFVAELNAPLVAAFPATFSAARTCRRAHINQRFSIGICSG
jgi:hypothetical protein